jgi:hypothetical protein
VAAGTIPVGEKLGCERYTNTDIFCDSMKEIARNPQVVTDLDAVARTNLVFPLSGHNFSVCSRDLNSSVKTRFVMHVRDQSSKANVGTN